MFYHPTCWVRTDIPPYGWYVRPSESLADGIAHKKRGQKGKLPFPFGAKNAPTLWCNLRTVLPQKDVAILI